MQRIRDVLQILFIFNSIFENLCHIWPIRLSVKLVSAGRRFGFSTGTEYVNLKKIWKTVLRHRCQNLHIEFSCLFFVYYYSSSLLLQVFQAHYRSLSLFSFFVDSSLVMFSQHSYSPSSRLPFLGSLSVWFQFCYLFD